MCWKRLRSILDDMYPGVQTECRRAEGKVTSRWRPLLNIHAVSREYTVLKWHPSRFAQLKIDMEAVNKAFAEDFPSEDTADWL